ncbi:MAG TPA: hypothetical protein VI854_04455 [Acidimicrobiia bacterium]|nr:hypothetical protein [Acidimicrobiia bacterium]
MKARLTGERSRVCSGGFSVSIVRRWRRRKRSAMAMFMPWRRGICRSGVRPQRGSTRRALQSS